MMTVIQSIYYDKRSFLQYYWDRLKFTHLIISAFFVKRNSIPMTVRIIALVFFISFQFALNAIFFSDSYISERNNLTEIDNNFAYTLAYQLGKSIWSLIIGSIPIFIMKPLLIIPKSIYKEYNLGLLEYDQEKADQAISTLYKKMMWRYALYTIIAILIHFWAWYYVTCFCGVYIKSSINWLYGGIITLVIKFLISQPILPLIRTIIRAITHRYSNKFWRFCYWVCRKLL